MRPGTVTSVVVILMLAIAAPAGAHSPWPRGAVAETDYVYRFGPVVGAVPCAIACSYWVDNGFTPCEKPFPPGSYVEHLTPPVPPIPEGKSVAVLEATLDPEIDWDSWACEWPSRKEIASGANILGDGCGYEFPPFNIFPPGCHEDMSALVTPGLQYLLIAYNFIDVTDAKGRSWVIYL